MSQKPLTRHEDKHTRLIHEHDSPDMPVSL